MEYIEQHGTADYGDLTNDRITGSIAMAPAPRSLALVAPVAASAATPAIPWALLAVVAAVLVVLSSHERRGR